MKLGVCYYPEHWPESVWPDDARRMRELGITVVRIGEFAWSRLEPARDSFNFEWLQRALDTLHAHGLEVVLGTPTATPPKWLIDEFPSILAIDEQGNPKGFGSRRHYCFSSTVYRQECSRIVEKIVKEFGEHPAVSTWQTDNEYGCHSTIVSYSKDAHSAFIEWCRERYGSIDNLNAAWGNVFWSMEYNNFEQIPLPMLSVTELNPAHRLAFWRFSSDQVASFNKLQTNLIRKYSPDRDVMHNFMGNFTEFDHYTTAEELDIAAWDNYPLGFLDRDGVNAEDQKKWFRTGHPDSSAFHHDLYRGMGRLWIIEQQPGPVNWAPHNPAPLPGMLRLWALEAMAHGAELMSWFRWRQMPAAQEQMHTGLLLPDGTEDDAIDEIRLICKDLGKLALHNEDVSHDSALTPAQVALVFDYAGDQMLRIQPQGNNYGPLGWVQSVYASIRRCGVDVDIVRPGASLKNYKLVLLANSVSVDDAQLKELMACDAHIVIGPRCGSKTDEYAIPQSLPPSLLQSVLPIKVTRVESLPDFASVESSNGFTAVRWREKVSAEIESVATFSDGWGFHYTKDNRHYLNACLDDQSLLKFIEARLRDSGIDTTVCSEGLRLKRWGALVFAFNYGPDTVTLDRSNNYLIGSAELTAADVAVWKWPT